MRILSFDLSLMIVLILQNITCAEFSNVPATQESYKCLKDSQNTLMRAETPGLEITEIEETVESDFSCSFNSSKEENLDSGSDDSKLIKNDDFKWSTIDYLKKILRELENESSKATEPFNRSQILKYIDKSSKLIHIFIDLFSYYKKDCNRIINEKMKCVVSNFNFFDMSFSEINEVLIESVGKSKANNVKNLREIFDSFKIRVNEIKEEFEQFKAFQNTTSKFDFCLKINVLNEHEKSLDNIKDLLYPMSNEEIKDAAELFKNGILKVVSGVYENLIECLESDYEIWIYNLKILNDILIDTGKCIEDLKVYLQ